MYVICYRRPMLYCHYHWEHITTFINYGGGDHWRYELETNHKLFDIQIIKNLCQ